MIFRQTEDSAISTKVLETTHGVKYSAHPSKPAFVGPGNRLLKTPPNWIVSKDTVAQSGQTWHPSPQPPLTGGPVRNNDRLIRPPSTSRQSLSSKTFHQKSFFDSTVTRASKNFDKDKPGGSFPRQWQKLDSLHLPQPPPSACTTLAPPTWQKQRLRRLSSLKQPNLDDDELNLNSNHCKDPLPNARRSLAPTANKSALRMVSDCKRSSIIIGN